MNKYLLTILVFLLASCQHSADKEDGQATLTVTIEPLRYFVQAIAGDLFQVTSIVPEGSSPETYDPTPQQLVTLSKSRAWLRIGHIGFEEAWTERIRDIAPGLLSYDTSEGIELIQSSHSHAHHVHDTDPHVWTSVPNARIIARNICKALCELDESHQTYYHNRLDSLSEVLDRTEKEIRHDMSGADPAFVIYHPALSYFARDYGLEQVCIEEEGKEPSPAHLQSLIRTCRKKHVRTVFIQQEFDRRNAELIAEELGLQVVTINPLSYYWEKEMLRIAKALNGNKSNSNDNGNRTDD